MNVTLRQMHYAAVLAETGHFGRAAERCFITQPALSQQIRLLEERCGTALFDRLGKTVAPTPFGREFVERVRPILQQAEAVDAMLVSGRAEPRRPLRFGLIPTVAPYLLPKLFPALSRQMPQQDFIVSESQTESLVRATEAGGLDLALIATAPPQRGVRLSEAHLFEDEFVLATPPSTTDTTPVTLATLDRDRMLLLDEGHCFRDQAIAACGMSAGQARTSFAATSLSTIVEFVANGQGVTLLPRLALGKEANGGRIAVRPLASPGAGRTLRLVWREATPFAAVFAMLAEVIREVADPPARGADLQPARARMRHQESAE